MIHGQYFAPNETTVRALTAALDAIGENSLDLKRDDHGIYRLYDAGNNSLFGGAVEPTTLLILYGSHLLEQTTTGDWIHEAARDIADLFGFGFDEHGMIARVEEIIREKSANV